MPNQREEAPDDSPTDLPCLEKLDSPTGSPPTASLSSLMELENCVSNLSLAHEIVVNGDFCFKPKSPPTDSLEGRVTEIIHRAFWDSLHEQLNSDPPNYSHAVILLQEVKTDPDDTEIPDPSGLTDDDLRAALLVHGVKAGPIVASTRALYEKMLKQLLQSDGHDKVNGAEKSALYSDSEEEEEENGEEDDEESGSEGAKEEAVEQSEQAQQESSQEAVEDTFKDLFPDTETTPTGIYATRRRPIKGAAGRPIQYAYPDTPLGPTSLERREVERRLLPIWIQILVFLIVASLLYFIYVCVEDDDSFSPFVALLDSLSQGSDNEEGLQAETKDTPAFFGQE